MSTGAGWTRRVLSQLEVPSELEEVRSLLEEVPSQLEEVPSQLEGVQSVLEGVPSQLEGVFGLLEEVRGVLEGVWSGLEGVRQECQGVSGILCARSSPTDLPPRVRPVPRGPGPRAARDDGGGGGRRARRAASAGHGGGRPGGVGRGGGGPARQAGGRDVGRPAEGVAPSCRCGPPVGAGGPDGPAGWSPNGEGLTTSSEGSLHLVSRRAVQSLVMRLVRTVPR